MTHLHAARKAVLLASTSALLLGQSAMLGFAADGQGGAGGGGGAGGAASETASGEAGGTGGTNAGAGGGGAGATGGTGGAGPDQAGGIGGAGGGGHGGSAFHSNALDAGGPGGGGGAHGYIGALADLPNTFLAGGNGGYGGGGWSGGGGGGGGGFGAVITGLAGGGHVLSGPTLILGGNGGAGGHSDDSTPAGAGGNGGTGVLLSMPTGTNIVTIATEVAGGNGGYNSYAITPSGVSGSAAGHGASGLTVAGGSGALTLINTSTIRGGRGGAGNNGGEAGAGGAGIIGSDLTILNAGFISGGLGGDGTTRANAINFTGGANRLELQAGSVIVGSAVVESGAAGTLVLGGDTTPSDAFDLSKIVTTVTPGATDEYVGFTSFEKTGTSMWTLEGTGAQDWLINDGTLRGDADSLGGDLTFGSGSGAGTRSIIFDQAIEGTYAGVIGGDGSLIKTGIGRLVLTGDNEVGVFTIHEGALQVDNGMLEQVNTGLQSFVGRHSGDDARLVIADGGSVTTGDKLHVGDESGSRGQVFVTGNGSNLDVADLSVGFSGEGALSVTEGGRLSTSSFMNVGSGNWYQLGDGVLSIDGAGSHAEIGGYLTIAGYGDGSSGHVALSDGGVLDVETDVRMGLRNVSGSASLNIGAASTDATDALAAGTFIARKVQFYEDSASLNFNHAGTAYVFDTPLESVNTGAGFIHHYAGDTFLTGDSTDFSGDTIIHGGKLSVSQTLGGTVTVEDGGILGGTGNVGNTTIASGGILAPGNSIGALTIDGSLNLHDGAFLNYEFGSPGTTAAAGRSDRIDVGENLTLDGTLNLAQSADNADGTAGLGYYRLMTYRGTLTDNGLEIGDSSAFAGVSALDIQIGDGNVDLFVGTLGDDTLQHWQGGDGIWNTTDARWLNAGDGSSTGDVPVAWAGNHAAFKNLPGNFSGGTVDVAGTQSFKGLQFVDEDYRLEGTGALETDTGASEIRVLADSAEIATEITGAGGIIKTQGGTLILSGVNTYEGGTTLLGGVLSVSDNTNLGAAAGNLTFDGGTLRVTGTGYTSTGRAVAIGTGGGGFDIADGSNVFHLSQDIVGNGDLVKRGEGALRLTGQNDYGNTLVEDGWLFGDAASISGDIANAGIVSFDQGTGATFAGDIAGLNGTDGVMIKEGTGTLTLDGTSTLDWTVVEGGLATEAARFGGDVLLDDVGTALGFVDSGNAAYGGAISGNGQFSLDGDGTVLLTGNSSGFIGNTSVNAGTLLVGDGEGNGALGGSLDVLSGGTLGGSGTVGSGTGSLVTVASGGTLSPGNSIGTLTIDGDLVFDAGSRFVVEVDPEGTNSDFVSVTGNTTLNGGSVTHIGATGEYDLRSTYTILSADGALSGKFEDVSSDFAFLNPDLIYDYGAGTIDLELARNDRDFASVALTRNQIATAGGIEGIGFDAGHEVYDAIVQLADDDDLIRASFDALSGEIHASAKTVLVEDSRFIRNAANDRIRAAFGNVAAAPLPVMAYGPDGSFDKAPGLPPVATVPDYGTAAWGTAFGSWGSTDGNGNAAELDRSTGGVLAGIDGMLGTWRVGALAGYSHSSFDVDARASSGSTDNFHLGLYGGTQWGAVGFRTGLAYTWSNIETQRSVAFPGFSDSLSADYDAGTFQAFGELGYSIETAAASFEPFINLAHVNVRTDSFTETGGAAALGASRSSTDTTFTTLGLRASTDFAMGDMTATARGMIGWRHAFGDRTPLSTHAFAGSDAFTVAGVPIAKDAAVIEAGLDFAITPAATLGISYNGQFGSGASDHAGRIGLNVRF